METTRTWKKRGLLFLLAANWVLCSGVAAQNVHAMKYELDKMHYEQPVGITDKVIHEEEEIREDSVTDERETPKRISLLDPSRYRETGIPMPYLMEYMKSDGDDHSCYQDLDRDGYYVTTMDVREPRADGSCDEGYVRSDTAGAGGDCNDFNSLVHPRRREIPANGIDDNCNGERDEPEFLHNELSDSGWFNTNQSAGLVAVLNDTSVAMPHEELADDLFAEVNYVKLSDTSVVHRADIPVETFVHTVPQAIPLRLEGLDSTSVYMMTLQFFRIYKNASWGFLPGPDGYTPPASFIPQFVKEYVGAPTVVPYFTATADDSYPERRSVNGRARMLIRAFREYHFSSVGDIGYLGAVDVDGTRFGADPDEWWCSEFYAHIAGPVFPEIAHCTNADCFGVNFPDYRDLLGIPYADKLSELRNAKRGNYIPCDWDQDGSNDHSIMFLAVDDNACDGTNLCAWVIEGNSGNQVAVKTHRIDAAHIAAVGGEFY